jgi:multisubunit Na+/H+ antiporter MnhB subunit
LTLILGLYWIIGGIEYGFWVRKGPGGGFIPVVAGSIGVIFSIVVLIQQRKAESTAKFSWMAFQPVVGILVIIALSYVVGMIISMGVYIFLWLKFIEKHTTKGSLSTGIVTAVVIYLVFVLWLRVPLPTGILGAIL